MQLEWEGGTDIWLRTLGHSQPAAVSSSGKDEFSSPPSLQISFPGGSVVKSPRANAGDLGSIPRLGRPPGEGNGKPLQNSCLENPMDRGVWQIIVHGVLKEGS